MNLLARCAVTIAVAALGSPAFADDSFSSDYESAFRGALGRGIERAKGKYGLSDGSLKLPPDGIRLTIKKKLKEGAALRLYGGVQDLGPAGGLTRTITHIEFELAPERILRSWGKSGYFADWDGSGTIPPDVYDAAVNDKKFLAQLEFVAYHEVAHAVQQALGTAGRGICDELSADSMAARMLCDEIRDLCASGTDDDICQAEALCCAMKNGLSMSNWRQRRTFKEGQVAKQICLCIKEDQSLAQGDDDKLIFGPGKPGELTPPAGTLPDGCNYPIPLILPPYTTDMCPGCESYFQGNSVCAF